MARLNARFITEQVASTFHGVARGVQCADFLLAKHQFVAILNRLAVQFQNDVLGLQARLPGGERIPVVMMTGLDDTASIERAFEAGGVQFVPADVSRSALGRWRRRCARARRSL